MDRYHLPKLNQEQMYNLNKPIICKKIEKSHIYVYILHKYHAKIVNKIKISKTNYKWGNVL